MNACNQRQTQIEIDVVQIILHSHHISGLCKKEIIFCYWLAGFIFYNKHKWHNRSTVN